jgi:hypothetical protein
MKFQFGALPLPFQRCLYPTWNKVTCCKRSAQAHNSNSPNYPSYFIQKNKETSFIDMVK